MGKKYRFITSTRIFGSVIREVEADETPEDVAAELEGDTVNYEEMRDSGYIVNVETEVEEWEEV